MKHVILILCLAWTTAFSQQKMYFHKEPKQDKDDPEVYNVTKNTELSIAGIHTYCKLEYINHDDLIERTKKDGELKMLSKEDLDQKIAELPAGGFIFITIKRRLIDQARLDVFTIVVRNKADEEILRGVPKGDMIPEYSSSPAGHFYNIGSIRVPEPFEGEVKVYVIDSFKEVRHEFLIRAQEAGTAGPR